MVSTHTQTSSENFIVISDKAYPPLMPHPGYDLFRFIENGKCLLDICLQHSIYVENTHCHGSNWSRTPNSGPPILMRRCQGDIRTEVSTSYNTSTSSHSVQIVYYVPVTPVAANRSNEYEQQQYARISDPVALLYTHTAIHQSGAFTECQKAFSNGRRTS